MFRNLLKGTAALSLSTGAFLAYKYQTDEGSKRMIQLYSRFTPIVLHYRYVQKRQQLFGPSDEAEREAEWETLHKQHAQKMVGYLLEMKGFYTKVGQVMAGTYFLLLNLLCCNSRLHVNMIHVIYGHHAIFIGHLFLSSISYILLMFG
jgi:hypothetical protein